MLDQHKDTIEGKKILISGSGNVATHAAEKCLQLGALPLTLWILEGSFTVQMGSHGTSGLDKGFEGRSARRISEAADEFPNVTFHEGRPWGVEADCAVPSATQNEVNADEAAAMIKNGVKAVAEAANMPCEQVLWTHLWMRRCSLGQRRR